MTDLCIMLVCLRVEFFVAVDCDVAIIISVKTSYVGGIACHVASF